MSFTSLRVWLVACMTAFALFTSASAQNHINAHVGSGMRVSTTASTTIYNIGWLFSSATAQACLLLAALAAPITSKIRRATPSASLS